MYSRKVKENLYVPTQITSRETKVQHQLRPSPTIYPSTNLIRIIVPVLVTSNWHCNDICHVARRPQTTINSYLSNKLTTTHTTQRSIIHPTNYVKWCMGHSIRSKCLLTQWNIATFPRQWQILSFLRFDAGEHRYKREIDCEGSACKCG